MYLNHKKFFSYVPSENDTTANDITVNSVKNNKNCASTRKSLKLCTVSVHSTRSKKPFGARSTPRSLILGILETRMGLNKKNNFFFKSIKTIYCWKTY